MDKFEELWGLQELQQVQLGLDPANMGSVERRRLTTDLVAQLHEEVSELGRANPTYKRHLLADRDVDPHNICVEVVDVIKLAIATAQLHNLTVYDVVDEFKRKTTEVASRVQGERAVMRKNIKLLCVDMDDTISDLAAWVEHLAKLNGGGGGDHWELLERQKHAFYQQGRFREMPPIEGAPEGMRLLKERGYTIVIVTARPQWQYKRLYADTLQWLAAHDVPFDHILFGKDKVEAVFQHLRPAWPVAFIEDHPRNALALAEASIPVLLLDNPRNRDVKAHEAIKRVMNWKEILEALA
jgi:uncharacterized HAD superfamily protein